MRQLQQKLRLEQENQLCRLQLAQKHIYTNKKWQRVTFTDKKEFNLDGPESLRRSMGGGGVMIWAVIGY